MRALLNCREYNDYQIAQYNHYTYNLLLDPLSVVRFLESADTQISATYPIVANILYSRNKDCKGIKYLRWDYTLKAILSHRAPSSIHYQNQNRVTKPSL